MKRAFLCAALLLAAAGYVFLQTPPAPPKLAAIMPGGALLYLESPDFAGLLRDWDASKVKADWLASANYQVFAQSNLFTKLGEVYEHYGAAAGFLPGLAGVREIAGAESALALYQIRDVEFLYVTRIGDGDLVKSQLWAARDKFTEREAGGVKFYLRTDAASQRTVAFAFTQGYLLVSTRDGLVGQALELLAGGRGPSVAADRWYRDSVAAAGRPGELRMVMNLEILVKSTYFRSYWVQRNVSEMRQYWAGVADVRRTSGAIQETRVFLRAPNAAAPAPSKAVSGLVALVPPDAGLYKASRIDDPSALAALIVHKLIAPSPPAAGDWRDAPAGASPDNTAGTEANLETRIDEPPLPADAGIADSITAVRPLADRVTAVLVVQSSAPAAGTFIQTPAVIVLESAADWDSTSVRTALAAAAGKLWTTTQFGAGWTGNPVERLDGLGKLAFATRGHLLFLASDMTLLRAVLDRSAAAPPPDGITYAAGFRHLRERPNYERIMTALDFTSPAPNAGPPHFFSENLASLSRVLSTVTEIRVNEEVRGAATRQTVTYSLQK